MYRSHHSSEGTPGIDPAELTPPYLQSSAYFSSNAVATQESKPYKAWDTTDAPDNSAALPITLPPLEQSYSLLTKCVAEFVGDLIFVFVGTMQAHTMAGADGVTHAALAHGFTIFILASTLGHISGGHFNPAVSWSVALAGKLPLHHFPCFVISQLLGGCCGALLTVGILSKAEYENTLGGATLLASGSEWYQGLIAETVVTFLLCHTILNTAVDTDSNVLAPLAIGLTLSIDIFATGAITGASMNPARSFGPNLMGQLFLSKEKLPSTWWSYHYIYWAGPLMGASIASSIFWLFQSRERRIVA